MQCELFFCVTIYFSDPYARIAFGTQSQVTEILTRTICPTWDQTLIFENVQIYGSIDKVANNPPEVIIELFDKDPVVSWLFGNKYNLSLLSTQAK